MSEEELAGRKLLVVGDVHGCYDELNELLKKCESCDSSRVCILFVGDLVNKGPKSVEVVRLVRKLGGYCVRGNHDELSLSAWQRDREEEEPLINRFQWMKELTEEEMQWLSELPFTLHIPSREIIVTHAGLVPGVAIQSQRMEDMLHMRDVHFDIGTLTYSGLRNPTPSSQPWAEAWEGPDHVYFGHDAKRYFQSHQFATGLDTGCVYGGHLTAVFPEEGNRKVQVKAHKVHKNPKTPYNGTPPAI